MSKYNTYQRNTLVFTFAESRSGFYFSMHDHLEYIFEDTTKDFLLSTNKTALEGIQIQITSLEILAQDVFDGVQDGILKNNERKLVQVEDVGLIVDVGITLEIQTYSFSSPGNVSYADYMLSGLYDNFTEYKNILAIILSVALF